jgi:uncharacterized protein (TIGR02246 family)
MITTTTPPTIADTATDHDDDIAAIGELVAAVEAGFNTNDADLMTAPFAENGVAVGVTGALAAGRAALLEAGRVGLAGPLKDQRARYELTDLTFLRPDVAIGHKRAWAIDADDRDLDVGHAMIALYVFVKESGDWWVAARQNTLVPSG